MTPKAERPDLGQSAALVTGATGMVGSAISAALAERGGRLVLCGRDERRLHDLAEQVRKTAGEVHLFAGDLTNDAEVERLVKLADANLGSLDVLVHTMGVYVAEEIERVSLDEFDRLFRTNVRAPFSVTQGLLPMMRGHQAQVVFLNSGVDLPFGGRAGVYAATKHALKAIADFLREEVNADGIRVLSVLLTRAQSPVGEAIVRMEGRLHETRRLARPEHIAEAVMKALDLPHAAEVSELRIRPLQRPPLVD